MAPNRLGLRIPPDVARRKFLFAFGAAYMVIGFSYVAATPSTPARIALSWLPVPFWVLGVLWMAAGATSILGSFLRAERDKVGFIALAVAPCFWTFSFCVSAALHLVPRAWVSVFVFGLIAYAVDTVSGMVDASKVRAAAVARTVKGRP